jgi:hypothetical protein
MSAIVLFVLVHVTLAILVPSTLVAMVTGRARVPAPRIEPPIPAINPSSEA